MADGRSQDEYNVYKRLYIFFFDAHSMQVCITSTIKVNICFPPTFSQFKKKKKNIQNEEKIKKNHCEI